MSRVEVGDVRVRCLRKNDVSLGLLTTDHSDSDHSELLETVDERGPQHVRNRVKEVLARTTGQTSTSKHTLRRPRT